MRVLIGIDDTDNPTTGGSAILARDLGAVLQETGLARVQSVTRHQLCPASTIHRTTSNAAACLLVHVLSDYYYDLCPACEKYVKAHSAPNANAGLCVVLWDIISDEVVDFGLKTKRRPVQLEEALRLAETQKIDLKAVTGSGNGMIGALAAVGLRKGSNDGRFVWLPGLRDLPVHTYTVADLCQRIHVDEVRSHRGTPLSPDETVYTGDWLRPILVGGKAVLFVAEAPEGAPYQWVLLDKTLVKELGS